MISKDILIICLEHTTHTPLEIRELIKLLKEGKENE